jgi:TRAP-type mannitol/chloroaromatic compound transport system substrate-binding protein
MKTDRRRLLTAGAAAAALAAPSVARAQTRVRWNLPTSWPPRLLLQSAPEILAQRVSDLTGGNFELRVYPAGELIPPLEVFGAVQAGTVECAHSWGGYYIGTRNAIAIDGGLPFGLNSAQHTTWWAKGGGREAMAPVYEEFDMIALLCGDTDAQMGGWFNKEITSVEDLSGLRLRIAGLAGRIFTELGASTQLIPGGEILTAMERGVIDGLQFNNPYDDLALGLHEVSRYYYYPCFQHPAAPLSLYVNRQAYDALPEEFRQALEIGCAAAHAEHIAHSQYQDAMAFARIMNEGADFEVKGFPDDVMVEASRINDEITTQFADEDPHFARVYPDWRQFTDDMRAFNGIGRFPFDRFVYS